ncbi:RNA-directed DNA polymerase, eukaryota, reverse transcriptase zinc-binding domain protein [Tanacetum coccineum]
MRQLRWLDLLKDYDCEIRYHSGKVNVVADALSRKEREKVTRIHSLRMIVTFDLFDKIKAAQVEALKEENWKDERITSYIPQLEDDSREIKTRQGRIYIPFRSNVKELLLEEAHKSKYSIHPGASKMYLDLKRNYWWPGMKRDCIKCVEKCLKVKAEHQKPYGKVQPLEIPIWKWEKITMDFVTKLPKTTKKHDAIWVIVDRLMKSAHFIPIREDMPVHKLAKIYVNKIIACHAVLISIVSDRDGQFTSNFWQDFQEELGTRLHMSMTFHPQMDGQSERIIQQIQILEDRSRELVSIDVALATTEKIETVRERLKEAQDRWKSYADKRRKPIEFNVGDFVMLKVSSWKGVMWFKNKGKLSPRFIRPFKILKRVEEVAYNLELPEEMRGINNTFHVSYLRKCLADESSVVTLDDVVINPELTFQEEPVAILGRKSRQLRNKEIPLVKVDEIPFKGGRVVTPVSRRVYGNYKPTIKDKDGKDVIITYEKFDENHKKMILYNALPKKEYERIFMCDTAQDIWKSLIITHQGNKQVKDNKIDLFVQKCEEFIISDDETIDYAFARFNTIITSLKALDESFSSRNHVRKFLRALPTKWRSKVTAIEESKDLSTLPLDELIDNLKVYEVVLEKDSKISKSKKEKRGKFVRQPHDDKKNFQKVKEDKKEKDDQRCFKCRDPNHFISDCPKHSFNDQKAFVVGCWSDNEEDKDEICLMAHDTNETRLKVKLEPDEWIKDSGCSRHMTDNKDLFSSYKTIDGDDTSTLWHRRLGHANMRLIQSRNVGSASRVESFNDVTLGA